MGSRSVTDTLDASEYSSASSVLKNKEIGRIISEATLLEEEEELIIYRVRFCLGSESKKSRSSSVEK